MVNFDNTNVEVRKLVTYLLVIFKKNSNLFAEVCQGLPKEQLDIVLFYLGRN